MKREMCRDNNSLNTGDYRYNVPGYELDIWAMILGLNKQCAHVAANGVNSLWYPHRVGILFSGLLIFFFKYLSQLLDDKLWIKFIQ